MYNYIEINGRKIGKDYVPLVIVELGINHCGSLDIAREMVDAAWKCGAEVIKNQTHIPEEEMSKAAKQVIPGNADVSIFEIMKKCSLSENDEIQLKEYVESKGMIYLSTPFSRAGADRLEKMGVSAYKIGSGECNNYPLIEHIATFAKPIILSTGMNNIESVFRAVEILNKGNIPYALLHTTNLYPTPVNLVRLGAMQEMEMNFPTAVIGLSDHTTENYACFAATALGASILERHFTDRMDRRGPDIVNSMDPKALKDLLIGCEEIYRMRGGKKEAAAEEKVTMDFAFASVVTIKKISKGEIFTEGNIWVKRPGNGQIKAELYKNIIGKKAKNNIGFDEQLKWGDIE